MKIFKYIWKWVNANRLRKVLSSILAILILLTSIRYIFLSPKEVKAADVYLGFNEGYGTSNAVNDTNGTVSAGSITNAVWKSEEFCKVGKCLYFDGTGDYVSFTDNSALDIGSGNAVTIEGWFRTPDITSGTRVLVAKHNSTAGGYKIYMDSNGYLTFGIDGDSTWTPSDTASSSNTSTALDDNKWHHFAAVKDITSISLYVDGVLQQTDSSITANSLANSDTFYLGIDGNASSNGYSGFLDEIKMLRAARSSNQIKTDYLGNSTSITGANPVGWWKMDETAWTNDCSTATVMDSSGNGNNGKSCPSSTGPTTPTSGKFANGGVFDGTNDWLDLGSGATLNPTSTITLGAWVKLNNTTGIKGIISKNWSSYSLEVSGNQVYVRYRDETNTLYEQYSTGTLSSSTWYHLATTIDSQARKISIYINGNLDSTFAFQGNSISSTPTDILHIGANGSGATTQEFFGGMIDDARIYNYIRSQSQIFEDMLGYPESGTSASFGPDNSWISNGLVGYWKMDESSWSNANCGTTKSILDSSGNGNDGSSCPTSTGPTGGATGKFGYGGSFNGSTDYVQVTDNTSYFGSDNNFSAVMWVYSNSWGASTVGLLAKRGSYATQDWMLVYNTGGNDLALVIGEDGGAVWIEDSSSISTGTWHQLGFTKEGTTYKLFVDGVQTTSVTSTQTWTNSDNIVIGNAETGGSWALNGKIDDVRMYNRVLSPNEIQKLYHWAPGPVGYWKLDEGQGTSAYDSSTNGITGTLGNTTSIFWRPGKFGSGITTGSNNSTDQISLTNSASVKGLSAFTTEGWVYPTSSGTSGRGRYFYAENCSDDGALGRNVVGVVNNYVGCGAGVFGAFFRSAGQSSVVVCDPNTFTPNTWYHVAAVYNSDTDLHKLYVNGVLVNTSTTSTPAMDVNNPINTPKLGNFPNSTGYNFPGVFDDVKLYSYERTQAQIIEDMNGGHPAPGSPVGSALGHWDFDQGYGTTTYNSGSVGSSADGTLAGTPLPTWTNDGKFGKAINFVTTGSTKVTLTNSVSTRNMSEFTIAAWVKPSSLPSSGNNYDIWAEPVSDTLTSVRAQIHIGNNYSGCGTNVIGMAFRTGISTSTRYDVCGTTALSTGTWYFVTGVFNSTTGIHKVYLNGREDGTLTQAVSAIANTDPNVVPRIGIYANDNSDFGGTIDEVSFYNSALSADQIKELYNQSSMAVMGATSTDSSGNATWSDTNSYCPPGQGTTCTGPLGEWKFDEGTGTSIYDTSGNGYNVTALNNIDYNDNDGWKPGKQGWAFQLDGTNDSIQVANSAFSLIGSDFTVEAWVKLDSQNTNYSRILTYRQDASNGYHLAVVRTNDGTCPSRFLFEVDKAATYYTAGCSSSSLTASNNTWYHVVGTFTNATNTPLVYVNGVLQSGTTTASLGLGVTTTLTFGSQSTAGSNLLDGTIDLARIYNYVRTQPQVSWDYNRGNPIGWWQMDETSWNGTANEVKDASGNAMHGVRVGDATTTAGKINNAGTFDATGDYVNIGDPSNGMLDFGTGDFSVSAWFYRNSNATTNLRLLSKGGQDDTAGEAGFAIYGSDNSIEFAVNPGGARTFVAANNSFSPGSWHHVVGVVSRGGNQSIYLDGTLRESNSAPSGSVSSSNNFYIGASTSGLYWPGKIDDVRVYNYALTPQQVKNVMNDNSTVKFWQ